jgi:hypothetical protein
VQIPMLAVPRITFNEAVRNTGFTVTLTGPNGAVAGSANIGADGRFLVFSPQSPLQLNASYTLVVRDIFDIAGNRLVGDPLTVRFQTEDTLGPTISTLAIDKSPVAGSTVGLVATLSTNEAGTSVRFMRELDAIGVISASPFVFNTALPTNGTVRYQAIATDRYGNDGEVKELEVTVIPNEAPVLQFSSVTPTNNVLRTGQQFTPPTTSP